MAKGDDVCRQLSGLLRRRPKSLQRSCQSSSPFLTSSGTPGARLRLSGIDESAKVDMTYSRTW